MPRGTSAWRCSTTSAKTLTERRFDAIELRGPGTELTIGLLPSGRFLSAQFERQDGSEAHREPADRRGLHEPGPAAHRGTRHVDEAAGHARRHGDQRPARALRGRPSGGDRGRRGCRRAAGAAGRRRQGIAARRARAGRQPGAHRAARTVFYDTLLDENAASHIALGSGFPFAVDPEDVGRVNRSGTHIDFMIGHRTRSSSCCCGVGGVGNLSGRQGH